MIIITDTREQTAFTFPHNQVELGTLKTGDYSLKGMTEEVGIERKSVSDAISSVFAGRDRFKKEWERGKEFKYFAIVIEGNKKSILKEVRKNNARNKGSYTKKINLPGQVESIVNTYLHWSVKYNVPVFFCKDRVEAEKVTLTLLTAFNKYKLKGEK